MRARAGAGRDAQETDGEADDEQDFVVVREAHDDAGRDAEHGQRDRLRLVEVVDVDERPATSTPTGHKIAPNDGDRSTDQSLVMTMNEYR